MRTYKHFVTQIAALSWKNLNQEALLKLMVLMHVSAQEFAESLRIALQLYPTHPGLMEMAKGELQTNNLQYDDYARIGDHADFLSHFIQKHGVAQRFEGDKVLQDAINAYRTGIANLSPEVRAMSIFSREADLPGIFQAILEAPDWNNPALHSLRYYIERHIALDTAEAEEGGHAALIADQPVTEAVTSFWELRLRMYDGVPELTGNAALVG